MLTSKNKLFLILLLALFSAGCGKPDRPTISLYRAVHGGDLAQLERHIYWGTDLNSANADGEMPLHAAARSGRFSITRQLLKHGADIEVVNQGGQTPIYVALMAGRTQIAELLVAHGARVDPAYLLLEVVRNQIGDRDVIEFLVKNGADLNRADAQGNSPLHLAVNNGFRVVAKLLIRNGANVNAENREGHTPLKLAMDRNNQDLIDLLQRNGAVLR